MRVFYPLVHQCSGSTSGSRSGSSGGDSGSTSGSRSGSSGNSRGDSGRCSGNNGGHSGRCSGNNGASGSSSGSSERDSGSRSGRSNGARCISLSVLLQDDPGIKCWRQTHLESRETVKKGERQGERGASTTLSANSRRTESELSFSLATR